MIDLGWHEQSTVAVRTVRRKVADGQMFFGFRVDEPDKCWRDCVVALEVGFTSQDLMQ